MFGIAGLSEEEKIRAIDRALWTLDPAFTPPRERDAYLKRVATHLARLFSGEAGDSDRDPARRRTAFLALLVVQLLSRLFDTPEFEDRFLSDNRDADDVQAALEVLENLSQTRPDSLSALKTDLLEWFRTRDRALVRSIMDAAVSLSGPAPSGHGPEKPAPVPESRSPAPAPDQAPPPAFVIAPSFPGNDALLPAEPIPVPAADPPPSRRAPSAAGTVSLSNGSPRPRDTVPLEDTLPLRNGLGGDIFISAPPPLASGRPYSPRLMTMGSPLPGMPEEDRWPAGAPAIAIVPKVGLSGARAEQKVPFHQRGALRSIGGLVLAYALATFLLAIFSGTRTLEDFGGMLLRMGTDPVVPTTVVLLYFGIALACRRVEVRPSSMTSLTIAIAFFVALCSFALRGVGFFIFA